ncbi:amidase family protein [Cupriavidus basilensis]
MGRNGALLGRPWAAALLCIPSPSNDELQRTNPFDRHSSGRGLRRGDISPIDLIDAAENRIAEVEPMVNALPTLCFDRARQHAARMIREGVEVSDVSAGWLAGLPITIKDMTDVAGVRTTYGSPIFKDHVPGVSHPLVSRLEKQGGIVIAKSNTPGVCSRCLDI